MRPSFTLALIGNPNSGKTTLFNGLTGSRQKVGNWPGVTVEKKSGNFSHGETKFELVDLPGTYSLHISNSEDSLDQQIAQNFILHEHVDLLINIIDASSLEKGLYLTTQLLDAGLPVVVALNMMDVAHHQGVHIDPIKLSENLGIPVIPIVANRKEGIDTLADVVVNRLDSCALEQTGPVLFSDPIENALSQVIEHLEAADIRANRFEAIALLEQDEKLLAQMPEKTRDFVKGLVDQLESQTGGNTADHLVEARYRWITQKVEGALHQDDLNENTLTNRLDRIFLNRFLAFPLFLAVMYLMFMFTINLGGAFIDFFDITAGAIFVEIPRYWLTLAHSPEWLTTLIADGAGGGIQLVASFIPIIGALFIFQSFLEASGYMSRGAFIVDRLMRHLGLPGKSLVPLVVGFGCNVPSVMSARTLDNYGDRLLTILMAPFMSCGARLTVYVLFAAVFFPTQGQNVVFALYLLGILMAVFSGFLVKRHLMNKDIAPLVMELPNYHVPTFSRVMISAWHRLKGFVLRAGKAIVIVVIALNFLNSLGTDGSFGNQDSEDSVLSVIGMQITPVFEPMGIQEENWPATVGIFSGIFAKEVVVGTLDALYTSIATDGAPIDAPDLSTWQMIEEGLATIPANLADLGTMLADPLGIGVGDLSDPVHSAEDQEVQLSTFDTMHLLFGSAVAAFAYIVFVLLYMPCVATLGAIYKEAGSFWAFFAATWNTLIAYSLAVVVFQLGSFTLHPLSSSLWAAFAILLCTGGTIALFYLAKKQMKPPANLIPTVNLPS